jgi:hypothetical protein
MAWVYKTHKRNVNNVRNDMLVASSHFALHLSRGYFGLDLNQGRRIGLG